MRLGRRQKRHTVVRSTEVLVKMRCNLETKLLCVNLACKLDQHGMHYPNFTQTSLLHDLALAPYLCVFIACLPFWIRNPFVHKACQPCMLTGLHLVVAGPRSAAEVNNAQSKLGSSGAGVASASNKLDRVRMDDGGHSQSGLPRFTAQIVFEKSCTLCFGQ